MKSILHLSVFVAIAAMSMQAHPQSMSVNLAPQQSKMLANSSPLTINATCTIQTKHDAQKIQVHVHKNNSHVNGLMIHDGEQKTLKINNHDSISVSAEPGAEVTIVNQGEDSIQAVCSA